LIDQKILTNRGLRTIGVLLFLLALVGALYCSNLLKDENVDEFLLGNSVLVIPELFLLLGIRLLSLTCLSFFKRLINPSSIKGTL